MFVMEQQWPQSLAKNLPKKIKSRFLQQKVADWCLKARDIYCSTTFICHLFEHFRVHLNLEQRNMHATHTQRHYFFVFSLSRLTVLIFFWIIHAEQNEAKNTQRTTSRVNSPYNVAITIKWVQLHDTNK